MMQLKISTVLIFLGWFHQIAWAQSITWGDAYEQYSRFNLHQIVQAKPDQVFVLHKDKNEAYFFRHKMAVYNSTLEQQIAPFALETMASTQQGQLQFVVHSKTSPYLGFSKKNTKKQREMVYLQKIDQHSLLPDTTTNMPLFEVAYTNKKQPSGRYAAIASKDATNYLVYGVMPYSKERKGRLKVWLGNAKLEPLATKVIALNQKTSLLALDDVVDAVLDKKGTAYLLCKLYKNKAKKEEKKNGTRFVYSLISMDKEAKVKQLDTLKILAPEDSAVVVSAKLSINAFTQEVACWGTYKAAQKKMGLFKLVLTQQEWETVEVLEYPEDLLVKEKNRSKKQRKKKHLGLENYKVKYVLPQKDGSQIIAAEQHHTTVYWDKSEGRQALHQVNNILVVSCSKEGELNWLKILPKRQTGGGEGYSNLPQKLYSFGVVQHNNSLHILYNDLDKNEGIEDEYALLPIACNHPKNCSLIDCELDIASGKLLQKTSLLNLKKDGKVVFPKQIQWVKDGKVFLEGLLPKQTAKGKMYTVFGYWNLL